MNTTPAPVRPLRDPRQRILDAALELFHAEQTLKAERDVWRHLTYEHSQKDLAVCLRLNWTDDGSGLCQDCIDHRDKYDHKGSLLIRLRARRKLLLACKRFMALPLPMDADGPESTPEVTYQMLPTRRKRQ
jgi:hypothetical protein